MTQKNKKNEIKLVVFFLLLISCNLYCQNNKSAKAVDIKLIEEKCKKNLLKGCDCLIQRFSCDTNIYFIKTSSNSPDKFTSFRYCFGVKLHIYDQEFSLDSIYYQSIGSKDALSIKVFGNGSYKEESGNIIELSLDFGNFGINTSRGKIETFFFRFDKKSGKMLKTNLSLRPAEGAQR